MLYDASICNYVLTHVPFKKGLGLDSHLLDLEIDSTADFPVYRFCQCGFDCFRAYIERVINLPSNVL